VFARQWDPARYCWVVHAEYVSTLVELVFEHMGVTLYL
jgi:hypothetical protein